MVNKVILIGNVGADPEVKYLDGGTAVARIRLATTESYKDRNTGERIDQTEWHNLVLWRGLAEIAEKYIKKGHRLYIEGRIRNRSWEDKDGTKRYSYEIQVDNLNMLTPKSESSHIPDGKSNSDKNEREIPEINKEEFDDLPF